MIILSIGAGLVILVGLLWFLGNYNIWRPALPSDRPRVLMYHSVAANASDLSVSPENFERQIRWLKEQGYCFVTISELVSMPLKEKVVALTFDDGFEDNYTNMFPVIQRYGAKATIYLAPEMTGIEKLSVPQIEEMQASGLCEFGAHTMHHVNLSQLAHQESKEEIIQSKQRVEQITQVECRAFAYPYGRFTDETVEIVKDAGFLSAVTVKKGIESISDRYRIKRVSVLGHTNFFQFRIAISRGRYRV